MRYPQGQILSQLLQMQFFSVEDISRISQLQSIRNLTFPPESSFAENSIRLLSKLRWLQMLHFNKCTLTAENLSDIAMLPHLTSLYFTNCSILSDASESLIFPPKITTLGLIGFPITATLLRNIIRLSQLKHLNLSESNIKEHDISILALLPKLNSFVFHNTEISNDDILSLASAPSLTTIYGVPSRVTEEGYDQFFREQLRVRRQRNKGVQKPIPDRAIQQQVQQAVLGFMGKYFEWEILTYNLVASTEDSQKDSDETPFVYQDVFWERRRTEYQELIGNHCTLDYIRRARTPSYGTPPKVDPTKTKFIEIIQLTKNKILVYTKEWNLSSHYYEYTLHLDQGTWKIANRRWWINSGWLICLV